jgi:hypothetical protein
MRVMLQCWMHDFMSQDAGKSYRVQRIDNFQSEKLFRCDRREWWQPSHSFPFTEH